MLILCIQVYAGHVICHVTTDVRENTGITINMELTVYVCVCKSILNYYIYYYIRNAMSTSERIWDVFYMNHLNDCNYLH